MRSDTNTRDVEVIAHLTSFAIYLSTSHTLRVVVHDCAVLSNVSCHIFVVELIELRSFPTIKVPTRGNFRVSTGIGTGHRLAKSNCWNVDDLADLAEIILIIVQSPAKPNRR